MRRRARNRISVGSRATSSGRNRRENRPAFLWTKKSACPIAREALVQEIAESYQGISDFLGFPALAVLVAAGS